MTLVDPRLAVESVSKTFGSARVLRDVALDVRAGEIHALIGQNGSGKSTLAKVLTGLYAPDPGSRVLVDGRPLRLPVRPAESQGAGVAVVHQSLGLVDAMTVLENTRLGRLRSGRFGWRIDWRVEAEKTAAVFARLGRSIPLDAKVGDLREDERATVAIARALEDLRPGHGLVILDESTRSLGRAALEHFYEILDGIVATGTSVLLITHRLEEVVDAADRVSVLRDGEVVVAGRQVEGMTKTELAQLMLGEEIEDLEQRTQEAGRSEIAEGGEVVVESLTGAVVTDLGFKVRAGEVLGVTGLGGSGFDEVPYLVSGASPALAGTVTLSGTPVDLPGLTPAAAVRAGIALVPESRESAGLVSGMSMTENISFPQTCAAPGRVRPLHSSAESALAYEWIDRLGVRPPNATALVGSLSGGNQQKVLLAKWLATAPSLLVLHEPTQAVDVGARRTIVETVRNAAEQGCSVLVAGSDENELALLCDRVLVLAEGRIERELTGELTPREIVDAIYTEGSRSRLRQRTKSMTKEDA